MAGLLVFTVVEVEKKKGANWSRHFVAAAWDAVTQSHVVFSHTTRAPRATVALSGCLLRATHMRADFTLEVG